MRGEYQHFPHNCPPYLPIERQSIDNVLHERLAGQSVIVVVISPNIRQQLPAQLSPRLKAAFPPALRKRWTNSLVKEPGIDGIDEMRHGAFYSTKIILSSVESFCYDHGHRGEFMNTHEISELAWERMATAVEKVRDRLRRAVAVLEAARIPYAVVGGHAVAAWVAEVNEAAVRNTQDVDILLRRADLERTKEAMAKAGFIFRHVKSIDMFLDGPNAKARDAVHILFAEEKVRPESLFPAPDVDELKESYRHRVVSLEGLLRMKLTSFRDKDRTHIRDLIEVGLVDASWLQRLPAKLAERLQSLLDNPEG